MLIKIKREFNMEKLHKELLDAGLITPVTDIGTTTLFGNEIWVADDTPQEIIDAISAIVAVHDPTPLPPPKTEVEVLQERVDTMEFDNANLLLDIAGKQTQIDMLGMDNANLLLDNAEQQTKIDTLEFDNANLLLDNAEQQQKIDSLEFDTANILLTLASNNII